MDLTNLVRNLTRVPPPNFNLSQPEWQGMRHDMTQTQSAQESVKFGGYHGGYGHRDV